MPGTRNIVAGIAWTLGGLALQGISHSAPSAGGVYVVACGSIAAGCLQFAAGLLQLTEDRAGASGQNRLLSYLRKRIVSH
jgi:hypothetical protein